MHLVKVTKSGTKNEANLHRPRPAPQADATGRERMATPHRMNRPASLCFDLKVITVCILLRGQLVKLPLRRPVTLMFWHETGVRVSYLILTRMRRNTFPPLVC